MSVRTEYFDSHCRGAVSGWIFRSIKKVVKCIRSHRAHARKHTHNMTVSKTSMGKLTQGHGRKKYVKCTIQNKAKKVGINFFGAKKEISRSEISINFASTLKHQWTATIPPSRKTWSSFLTSKNVSCLCKWKIHNTVGQRIKTWLLCRALWAGHVFRPCHGRRRIPASVCCSVSHTASTLSAAWSLMCGSQVTNTRSPSHPTYVAALRQQQSDNRTRYALHFLS
jgi:hypothetical protein